MLWRTPDSLLNSESISIRSIQNFLYYADIGVTARHYIVDSMPATPVLTKIFTT